MINQSIKDNVLKNLVSLQNITGRGQTFSGYSSAYVGLAKDITVNANGNINNIIEPASSTGYKRYCIAQIDYSTSASNAKVKLNTTTHNIENTDTLYFDEAVADYGIELKYYFLASQSEAASGNTDAFAYGRIVDEYGNPTSLIVVKDSLPIIRKGQLQISLVETEKPTYTLTKNYGDTETTISGLYCIPALETKTASGKVIEGWFYDATFLEPVGTPSATNQIKLTKNTTIYAKFAVTE